MIEFILCDDNSVVVKQVTNIINKVMMKNNNAYTINSFNDYDSKFWDFIKAKSQLRVYLLDIEMPSHSGIDVARMIRKNDVNSVIIFLTSHNELGPILLENEIMFLAFICKYANYTEKVESSIKKAIEVVGKNNVIRFEDQTTTYTIPLKDILYIYRESIERRLIIKTSYSEFKTNYTFKEMSKYLDEHFVQSHRSCIINMQRVRSYDSKTNKLLFDDGSIIDLVSSKFRKDIEEYGIY